eukprot:gb/GEZN01002011.1/.p1 GENE.gb/GEZN01002011.1/~~gb/GEZN01002011.1/.p1  ORF type:complete len:592 (+),score=67.44 gb/GEZN01002011.1/:696-2471(+)
MPSPRPILWLDNAECRQAQWAGDEGAALAQLNLRSISVSPGFCLSVDACRRFLAQPSLQVGYQALRRQLGQEDHQKPQQQEVELGGRVARLLGALFRLHELPLALRSDILQAYQCLSDRVVEEVGQVGLVQPSWCKLVVRASFPPTSKLRVVDSSTLPVKLGVCGPADLLSVVKQFWLDWLLLELEVFSSTALPLLLPDQGPALLVQFLQEVRVSGRLVCPAPSFSSPMDSFETSVEIFSRFGLSSLPSTIKSASVSAEEDDDVTVVRLPSDSHSALSVVRRKVGLRPQNGPEGNKGSEPKKDMCPEQRAPSLTEPELMKLAMLCVRMGLAEKVAGGFPRANLSWTINHQDQLHIIAHKAETPLHSSPSLSPSSSSSLSPPLCSSGSGPTICLHVCAFCGRSPSVLRRCGRCQSIAYCDQNHQIEHWTTHRTECRKIISGLGLGSMACKHDRGSRTNASVETESEQTEVDEEGEDSEIEPSLPPPVGQTFVHTAVCAASSETHSIEPPRETSEPSTLISPISSVSALPSSSCITAHPPRLFSPSLSSPSSSFFLFHRFWLRVSVSLFLFLLVWRLWRRMRGRFAFVRPLKQ